MIDMEKVIKGIDICLQRFRCGEDCPYYNYEKIGCMEQLREDALALLKEQEAKNVVNMMLSKDWFRIASCPKCNELLTWVSHRNYCGYCGQEVKWE